MAFSHTGLLGDRLTGKGLEIGVCATASAGFLLFGYGKHEHRAVVCHLSDQIRRPGRHERNHH
jgi:hypothetical protein